MNDGKVNRYRYNALDDYLDKMRFDLNSMAVKLQKSQNNLSQTVYDFSNENKYIINSNNVTLYYNTFEEVG
jgi:sugar-specific transcriptional regulator TrmB